MPAWTPSTPRPLTQGGSSTHPCASTPLDPKGVKIDPPALSVGSRYAVNIVVRRVSTCSASTAGQMTAKI